MGSTSLFKTILPFPSLCGHSASQLTWVQVVSQNLAIQWNLVNTKSVYTKTLLTQSDSGSSSISFLCYFDWTTQNPDNTNWNYSGPTDFMLKRFHCITKIMMPKWFFKL